MSIVAIKKAVEHIASSSSNDQLKSKASTSTSYGSLDVTQVQLSPDSEANIIGNNSTSSNASSYNYIDDEPINNDQSWSLPFFSKSVDPRVMSDVIIGLSDGLTVPFALTAGLSSLGNSKLVITGGLAELVSGAISMGLGGYLAAKSEEEFYESEVLKEKLIYNNNFNNNNNHDDSNLKIIEVLNDYNITDKTINFFIKDLNKNPNKLIDFIIRFNKNLEKPTEGREFTSALTIGLSYFFSGFIPLIPYFFIDDVKNGLIFSVLIMMITLFWFGWIKTIISIGPDSSNLTRFSNALQMVVVGGCAAASAWGLVKLIQ